MKARIWSYEQLPKNLQRCFAILSILRKGFRAPRQLLIDLWMAEGFIWPKHKQERSEDIGENYLDELVSRFFIEEVDIKKEKQYQLHDLLHDLAEWVQGDDLIRIDSTISREVPSHISDMLSRSENIRHIHLPSNKIHELKEKLCLMKNMCSFCVDADGVVFVPKEVLEEILKNFKKLRVLCLPYCVDDLPDSIGNLKHLRFLRIDGSQPLNKLPDSICKLYHLQTLFLPSCESLPKDFSELISLRRIETVPGTMPHISDVGRLTSLQCLDQFVVRKKQGNELHQLENLNQLRGEMCITGLENVGSTSDAVKANMRNKMHLHKLEFEWNSDERGTDNVTGLSTQHVQLLDALQPHPNISALTLQGFKGDRLPNWLQSPNSLRHITSLTLMNCDKVEEISSIDKSLPNCKSLILRGLKNLKKVPSLPSNLTYVEINRTPQLSYFSEDDLLMQEQKKQSKLEVINQIAECLITMYVRLPKGVELSVRQFLQFVKERLEVAPEIRMTSSQHETFFSDIVEFDPFNNDYSLDQLLHAWVICMHCHIETVLFNKNKESKLVLPPSLTTLEISSGSITSDALSTCIKCLISLSKLKLSNIQTITSLPPKEVLCLLKNLRSLTIEGCHLLSSWEGIGALTSLIELELKDCMNLSTSNELLPSSLERLLFQDCSKVDVVQNRRGVLHVGHLSFLKELSIIGWNGHLEGLHSLTALCSLIVARFPEFNTSSPMDKYAFALREVFVDNLLLLKLILSNETISSLEILTICSLQGDSSDDEVFQSFTSLKHVLFYHCNITHLPMSWKNLASLQHMYLGNCPNLCELELEELPMNLCDLQFKDCPTLTEKFSKGGPNYRVLFHEGVTTVIFPTEEERNRF